jgi:phosphotriesterase-related protein
MVIWIHVGRDCIHGVIETVLGPIPAQRLGITSMHEHVLCDARALADDDDYALDDAELAAAELARALDAGQGAIVDPTAWGFGGPSPDLPALSKASGLHIVAGVGLYLPRTRPDWVSGLSVGALAELLTSALRERLPGCEHRAGIVGVVAPGHPLAADDERILEVAGGVAADTGSALILRVDPRFADGPALVARLAGAGLAAERIVLSNIDGYATEPGTLDELAATGATMKWCFGYEIPPRPPLRSATDAQRADAVCRLWERGATRQVLACGVWTRSALHAHGGFGYDHLLRSAVPQLRRRGLDAAALDQMLVAEPVRLLDR